MLIVAYDITSNKVRTKFSKFLKKFGRRLQYSVFEIRNSTRILNNILTEIEHVYKKKFKGSDSIIIFPTCKTCDTKTIKYGYAKNDDCDIVFL